MRRDAGELLDAYLNEAAARHAEPANQLHPVSNDAGMSNMRRQGYGTEPRWPTNAYNLQTNVTIITDDCNPDLDIFAPGSYTIQVCQETTPTEGSEPVASVYRPDGTYIAGLTLQRLSKLQHAYQHCRSLPSLEALQPGTFEEELAGLLLRSSPRALKKNSTAQQASKPTAPNTILAALYQGLGITKERNKSPLTVHPATEAYWSSNQRDQLFGALYLPDGEHQMEGRIPCQPTTFLSNHGKMHQMGNCSVPRR